MPRSCTVCIHPQRANIEEALVGGGPLRDIARHWSVSKDALSRHRAGHLPAALAQAKAAQEAARSDGLLAELDALRMDAKRIQQRAERLDNLTAALAAVREQSRIIELLLRVAGELAESATTVNILVHPEWLALRSLILNALANYPDAKLAVIKALEAQK